MRRSACWAIWVLLGCVSLSSTVQAASVVLDRAEFVTLLGNVKLLKERLAQAQGEVALRTKAMALRDEQLVLQQQTIDELVALAEQYEKKDLTEAELHRAVEARLGELERMDRWKSLAVIVEGVIIAWMAAKLHFGR